MLRRLSRTWFEIDFNIMPYLRLPPVFSTFLTQGVFHLPSWSTSHRHFIISVVSEGCILVLWQCKFHPCSLFSMKFSSDSQNSIDISPLWMIILLVNNTNYYIWKYLSIALISPPLVCVCLSHSFFSNQFNDKYLEGWDRAYVTFASIITKEHSNCEPRLINV